MTNIVFLQVRKSVEQKDDENIENQLGDIALMYHQILSASIERTVWLSVRRIYSLSLGLERLISH